MRRTTVLVLGAAAASCLLLSVGGAPPVNPYTGLASAPPVTNPLTGRPVATSGSYNPLTGKLHPGMAGPGTASHDAHPVTGKAGAGLEALDKVVMGIMDRHGIPGASLAITRHGKLVYAKGIGWADLVHKAPVEPQTSFGLASLSKPLTAMAVLLLVERGKLSLDDHALDHLKHIKPPRGAKVDPRLRRVTIRQLLNHTGGWDRNVSGDPVTWSPQIARALGGPLPITNEKLISFMMAVPLNFNPGTRFCYSNVGCMLLDEIIEKVSGERYEAFVRDNVLKPAGMTRAYLSTSRTDYMKGEARCYLAGSNTLIPPMNLPMGRAAAGWSASAVDMVRFLTALDGSRGKALIDAKTFEGMVAAPPAPLKKRPDGTYPGLGWSTAGASGKSYGYTHDGNWPGARAFMKANPSKGVTWALLFNVSMQPDPIDQGEVQHVVRDLHEELDRTIKFGDLDLFADYP